MLIPAAWCQLWKLFRAAVAVQPAAAQALSVQLQAAQLQGKNK